MSKQTNKKLKVLFSILGVIVICLSIFTIMGFFEEGTIVGNTLAGAFSNFMGMFSWLGPFLTLSIGILLLIYNPRLKEKHVSSGTGDNSTDNGKLVSKGSGFNSYFADSDPLNEQKERPEQSNELDDVGENFQTYFGSEHGNVKLVKVDGAIKDYFADEEAAAASESILKEHEQTTPKLPADQPQVTLRAFINKSQTIESPKSFQSSSAKAKMVSNNQVAAELGLPPITMLDSNLVQAQYTDGTAEQNAAILLDLLNGFGINVTVSDITQGPAITRYELQPAPGIKISRIVSLADDMALALAAPDVRIEAPIPGKSAIGIEVPNRSVRPVKLREVLDTDEFRTGSKLHIALGQDITGQPVIADLALMPHLLVAGTTGSGKSVCMNTIITSILFLAKPDEVKFLLIDPKMVELNRYNGIPHLIAPVVTDPKKAAAALRWMVNEMEGRYELFAAAGVRDIQRYNEINDDAPVMPYVVVLIDELADLMMVAAGDVEDAICRLAQMARAAGIHLVVATQRPSVDVITGIIKANIPSRIAFAVSSQIDSRTILDGNGAEKLLGKGDMLYFPLGTSKPIRVQGCYLADNEVEQVVDYWKGKALPDYLSPVFDDYTLISEQDNSDDDLFQEAGRLFISVGIASVSLLQRRLRIGYTRAARLMDILEHKGVVGGFEGSKPRQVLMSISEFEAKFVDN